MFFTIAFDVLVAAFLLYRQRRIRPVPRTLHLRLPIILGAIGIVEVLDYTHGHHVSDRSWLLVAGVTLVGAGLLGLLRAYTVKLWTSNNWVVRQGSWITIVLWVISLALHLITSVGATHIGAANFEASSFLLYLAITFGVQTYVVHMRALPLWTALGPEAGRPFQINFGAGPNNGGSFFAGFGDFGGFGGGRERANPGRTRSATTRTSSMPR